MMDAGKVAEIFLARAGARDTAVVDLFADEVDWFVPGEGTLPWGGKRSSKAEITTFFELLWAATVPGKSEIRNPKLIVEGDNVIFVGRFSHVANATGRRFDVDVVIDLTIADGKIVRLLMVEDTLTAARAFGLV